MCDMCNAHVLLSIYRFRYSVGRHLKDNCYKNLRRISLKMLDELTAREKLMFCAALQDCRAPGSRWLQ